MARRSFILLVVLLLLAISAAALLTAEEQAQAAHQARDEDFERLVGGLGFGPALDLSDGASAFDPRLGGGGDDPMPAPGGAYFFARRAASLFAGPEPGRDASWLWEEGGHALPP